MAWRVPYLFVFVLLLLEQAETLALCFQTQQGIANAPSTGMRNSCRHKTRTRDWPLRLSTKDVTPTNSAEERTLLIVECKKRLMAAVGNGGVEKVLSAARDLERLAPAGEAEAKLVGGEWALLFSTQTDKPLAGLSNGDESVVNTINAALYKFFFKFAPFLAGGQDRKARSSPVATKNQQLVDLINKRVDNRVFLKLGTKGPEIKIRVVGDLEGDDPLNLAVIFDSFSIGTALLPTIKLPLPRPKGSLRTTFCDNDMRLSRGGRGGIFVLKKAFSG